MLSVLVSAFAALVSVVDKHFICLEMKDMSLCEPVGLAGRLQIWTRRVQAVSRGWGWQA
jgi:hypothetical protein